ITRLLRLLPEVGKEIIRRALVVHRAGQGAANRSIARLMRRSDLECATRIVRPIKLKHRQAVAVLRLPIARTALDNLAVIHRGRVVMTILERTITIRLDQMYGTRLRASSQSQR